VSPILLTKLNQWTGSRRGLIVVQTKNQGRGGGGLSWRGGMGGADIRKVKKRSDEEGNRERKAR